MKRQRIALIAVALLATVFSVVGTPPRPSRAAPPNPLQPTMDPTPTDLPQSWVAGFKVSGHWFHAGDRVTGTITVKAGQCFQFKPCYEGTDWGTVIGQSHKCLYFMLTCSWYAEGNSVPHWVLIDMPIHNAVGPAHSQDYYAVVDKNTHVLDGHVTDNAGDPLARVRMSIVGPRSGSVTTDKTGYYYAWLPKGTYYVSVASGAGTRYFHPQTKRVVLNTFATADFVGDIHTTINLSKTRVSDSGLETATLTVHADDPLGQPVANHSIHVDVVPTGGQAAAVVCSAMNNFTGRIAPAGLISGAPYYVPVNQPTDKNGTLTYQVYFGTNSGKVLFSADDPSVTHYSGAGTVSAYSSVEATITGGAARSLPVSYSVPVHHLLKTSVQQLSAAGALTAIVQGLTVALKANQNSPTPVNLNGANGDAQKALLRAIEQSGVFDGFGLAPITGAGGSSAGVLIYARNGANNIVLDIATARILQGYTLAYANTNVDLPNRRDWIQNFAGGSAVLDYASAVPEQGLTYTAGLPYLPVDDAELATFDNTCVNRAPSL